MTSHHPVRLDDLFLTRRSFLARCGMGMGALSLGLTPGELLAANAPARDAALSPMSPKGPHFAAKAKRVIHIFANGGPSHVDTFDPKPLLDQYHGKTLPGEYIKTERKTGAAFRSPFAFRKYGQSGMEISELFPHVAKSADELCVIRSMHADVPNHEPSLLLMNCGDGRTVRPSFGSWVTYGLGSENQNLPGFVALCPGGYPIQESQNWQSAFLPGVFQGTYIDPKNTEPEKLVEHITHHHISETGQKRQLDLLREINRRHLSARAQDSQLEARVQSFELASRMQLEATDAFDLSKEPESIRKMYGNGVQGRQMLLARRLVERGVRFVQLWHGEGQPWDNHDDLEVNHRKLAGECDQAIGALLTDLKQRGMLEDTLVIWGGEFGRTPTVELPTPGSNAGKINGRDHNHYGFSMWLAGGGAKAGTVYGGTDEFGFKSVDRPVHIHDLHATLLHMLGFDHERLTFHFSGRDYRLTDVAGRVVRGLLA
jgi:hypothetical protein